MTMIFFKIFLVFKFKDKKRWKLNKFSKKSLKIGPCEAYLFQLWLDMSRGNEDHGKHIS